MIGKQIPKMVLTSVNCPRRLWCVFPPVRTIHKRTSKSTKVHTENAFYVQSFSVYFLLREAMLRSLFITPQTVPLIEQHFVCKNYQTYDVNTICYDRQTSKLAEVNHDCWYHISVHKNTLQGSKKAMVRKHAMLLNEEEDPLYHIHV